MSLAEYLAKLGVPADAITAMTPAQALDAVKRLTPDPHPAAVPQQRQRPPLRLRLSQNRS